MQTKVVSASSQVVAYTAALSGYSISAGGSACIVNLREEDGSGNILFQIKVAANDSKHYFEGSEDAVPFNGGLYVEFATGTPDHCAVFWD